MNRGGSCTCRVWRLGLDWCIATWFLVSVGHAGQWRLQVSPTYAWNMEFSVSGSSYSPDAVGSIDLPGSSGLFDAVSIQGYRPDAGDLIFPADNITQYADRYFDDGFVIRDLGTENPQAFPPGVTMYWGYDSSAAQYDPGAETLTFRRTGVAGLSGADADVLSYTRKNTAAETVLNTAASGCDRFGMAGVELAACYDFDRKLKGMGFGFSVGVSGSWGGTPRVRTSSYRGRVTENQYAETVRDSYAYSLSQGYAETYVYGDPGAVLPNLPEVYAGADQNDLWAVGPVIPNLPESRTLTTDSADQSVSFSDHNVSSIASGERSWGELYNLVDISADLDRYALWAGGSIEREIASVLTVFLMPRASLNYVDGEAVRLETLYLADTMGRGATAASWSEIESVSHWTLGVGMSGGVEAAIGESWSLGIRGGVEWLANDVKLRLGPNRVNIDLDNVHAAVVVGRAF